MSKLFFLVLPIFLLGFQAQAQIKVLLDGKPIVSAKPSALDRSTIDPDAIIFSEGIRSGYTTYHTMTWSVGQAHHLVMGNVINTIAEPGVQIVSENCSGRTLYAGDTCTINLSWTLTNTNSLSTNLFSLSYAIYYPADLSTPVYATNKYGLELILVDYSVAPQCKKRQFGSVIGIDTGSVGEVIPVVGAPFSLIYNTEYSAAFPASARMLKNSFFGPEMIIPSIQYFYDPTNGRLYGRGSSTKVESKVLSGGNIQVVSPSADEVYIFDSNGKHLETKSFLTGFTKFTFAYTGSNKLSTITDSYGNTTTFQRNSDVLSGILSPYGQLTNIYTNSNGFVSSIVNPNNESYSFTYVGSTDLINTFTYPSGRVSTFTYDSDNKLKTDSSSAGNFWSYVRTSSAEGDSVAETSQLGRVSTYTLNKGYNDYKNSKVEPYLGVTSSYEIDSNYFENVTPYSTTARSMTSDERFGSARLRLESENLTLGGVTRTTTYSQTISPSSLTDPFSFSSITNTATIGSNVWQTVYTASTKTSVNTSPAGATVTIVLDAYENPVSVQTGADIATTFNYDSHGRLAGTIQGSQNAITYSYNSDGFLQSITNALSQATAFTYDLAGRILTKTLPDNRVIAYSYDVNGNMVSVTPPNKPFHSFTFNAFDLPSAYEPPALTGVSVVNTSYEYNNDKQLTKITRPNGDTAIYDYGSSTSLLNSVTTPTGIISYTYLSNSPLIQDLTSTSGDIKDTYSYYGNKVAGDLQYTNSTNYLNGVVSFTYDSLHRVASRVVRGHAATNAYTISYTYNADNMPTTIGAMSLTYSYPSGRLSTTTLDKISDTRTYDAYGNLQTYTATYNPTSGSPQILYSYTLTRDLINRITGKTETINGVTTTYAYSYDSAGRLTTVTKNGAAYSSYTYDNNGNRISGSVAGAAFSATYDDQDRILTNGTKAYTYNANGEVTSIYYGSSGTANYSYDVFGNMTGATLTNGKVYAFSLDGRGSSIRKTEDGTQKYRFVYESPLRIAISVSSGVIQKEYVYAESASSPDYMNSYVSDIGTYRIIKDHLGSPKLVVNTSTGAIIQSMDYNDLGEVILDTNSGFQPYGFAGGIYDANLKMVKFGARTYDPRSLGRWMSKDPILFDGGDANLYGYVENDPINWVDPEGTTKRPGQVMENDAFAGGGGGTGGSANVVATIKPNGQLIGDAGSSSRIRVVSGGLEEAQNMFNGLCKGGTPSTPSNYSGQMVKFSDGGVVGLRPSSTSGPPTIDINVPGMSGIKIKFTGE